MGDLVTIILKSGGLMAAVFALWSAYQAAQNTKDKVVQSERERADRLLKEQTERFDKLLKDQKSECKEEKKFLADYYERLLKLFKKVTTSIDVKIQDEKENTDKLDTVEIETPLRNKTDELEKTD